MRLFTQNIHQFGALNTFRKSRIVFNVCCNRQLSARLLSFKNERGKISAEAWTPDDSALVMFPPQAFLQVLFGRRSFGELRTMYPDCWSDDDTATVVIETLFPHRYSNVMPIG